MIRAFIFDLDGVLTDTAEYHYRAWKRLADEEGMPFTREDNEALRGVSRRESLTRLLKGRQVSEEEAEALMARKNSYYQEMIREITSADVLPGARELLREIRAAGMKIAVASASKNAREVVDRLNLWEHVDTLCDGNEVQASKPAPDLFLRAAEKVGVPPAECVVVEDAEAGVLAGRNAGMKTIGLGPSERVGAADAVFPSLVGRRLGEILTALEKG